jgi:hypothetical protein
MKPSTEGPVGPGWKLAWIEAIARDLPNADGAPLAVGVAISSRVDSYGVVKNLTQTWIAQRLGVSLRTVSQGFAHLVGRGHVKILKAASGRGHANEIRIVRQPVSEDRRSTAEFSSESTQNPAWQTAESTQNSAWQRQESTQDPVQKHARVCVPFRSLIHILLP